MDKNNWLHIRKQEELPIYVFFEYYLEKGGHLKNLDQFTEVFFTIVGSPFPVITTNRIHQPIPYEQVIRIVNKYFDTKFEL